MPFVGAGARINTHQNSIKSKRKRRSGHSHHSGKSRGQQKIPRLICTYNMLIATAIALLIFFLGVIFCLLGYHALSIMGLPETEDNTKPSHFKKDISATKYVFLQVLYNLRFIGPIVMGMGGFVLLCVWVVMYNEKDRLTNGESKMISSDDDVYNKAIQDYLEREENSKSKFAFMEGANHRIETQILNNNDSLSYRSASFCSMNSSISKFGAYYLPKITIAEQNDQPFKQMSTTPIISFGHQDEFTSGVPSPGVKLIIPKFKILQMTLRNCSSDSEDIDKFNNQSQLLMRQSTTSSSSPTLNLPECIVTPSDAQQMFSGLQLQSREGSFHHLLHCNDTPRRLSTPTVEVTMHVDPAVLLPGTIECHSDSESQPVEVLATTDPDLASVYSKLL